MERSLMHSGYYRFRLRKIECVCLGDGSRHYALGNVFANVPVKQIQEALRQCRLPIDYITTTYTSLYVDTGERRVLVGTGAGNLAPTTGRLPHNMNAAGIRPGQIDAVVLTHAHPHHIGGAVDGEGRPSYTQARYYISKREWNFWFSELSMAKAPERVVRIARRNLQFLRDRMHLVEGESEIVPQIHAIPAAGHTPGHMVVEISSADESLLYIGDTALHPLHLEHPHWLPIYDILPEEAAASKRQILDHAATTKAWVMGQHFSPFPGLGTVVKAGEGWQWQPLEI